MSLGIPYMGSKRKIAKPLIDYMLNSNPNAKYFYDLFGGGGAMSFEALQRKRFKKVHYNELNTGIVNLLLKIRNDGITDEFYKWITREDFFNLKDSDCWLGGLAKTCWSFGNKQDGYLFGADIEDKKRIVHEIVVNKSEQHIKEFYDLTGLEIDNKYLNQEDVQKRRISISAVIKKQLGRFDLQQLERLQQLLSIQSLENIQSLEISNLSYEQVKIETPIDETIIYCDPPYKGTEKYQKDINHDRFLKFAKNSPYKIYVSSYDFELPCVFELSHRSSLSATNNGKKVIEKLFCNQEEKTKGTLF